MNAPKSEPLIFPRGIRFPRKNEMPPGNEDALARIAGAGINTGYVRNDEGSDSFSSYFEANVHAHNVFSVFKELAQSILPEVAAPLIGIKEEGPTFGPYTDKQLAINVLEPHKELLQHDGFLEFGITFQYQGKIEEIFVASPKYFKIWTNQPELVARVFETAGIPECQKLEFIDEYPMVSMSIDKKGNAAWHGVYDAVTTAFADLPIAIRDQ